MLFVETPNCAILYGLGVLSKFSNKYEKSFVGVVVDVSLLV